MSVDKPSLAMDDEEQEANWIALLSLCLAAFIIPLAMSAVNLALPQIALELQADAVRLSWLASLPLWGSVIFMLPIARAADIWGRKRLHLIGLTLFSVTSVAVVAVDQVNQLLALRVIQGIASSFIFATSLAMVTTLAGRKHRGTFLGIVSTCVYLGLTLGPVVGGWLTQWFGWRSVFWLPVFVVIFSIVLIAWFVEESAKGSLSEALTWHQRLDLKGGAWFALATSCIFFGLAGLPQWHYIGLFLLGCLAGWGFIRQQKIAAHPLVRIDLLMQNRTFIRSLAASFCMYSASFPILFIMSVYLQYIKQMTPAQAGQVILLQALFMALVAPFAGRLSDKYEPRIIATIGALFFVAGALVLAGIDAQSSIVQVQIGLIVLGIGFGLFSSPNNNAAMSAIDPNKLGVAAALLNLGRTGGNMFSTAIVVVLFNYFLGYNTISPEQFPNLFLIIRICTTLCAVYALCGAYFSWTRGRIR
ncbi:MAG: MFS family permease [Oceanospirillaceae bacterium]|jgi:MFS family permease